MAGWNEHPGMWAVFRKDVTGTASLMGSLVLKAALFDTTATIFTKRCMVRACCRFLLNYLYHLAEHIEDGHGETVGLVRACLLGANRLFIDSIIWPCAERVLRILDKTT
jgi:hypothetical protein